MAKTNFEYNKHGSENKMKQEGKIDTSLKTMALNNNKAGMEGLDVNKINEIIKKSSEGSKFYLHKQKCQTRIDNRIADMNTALAKLTPTEISQAQDEMDKIAEEMEVTRNLSRIIVHIDMDMFYAAVEMRDDPTLKNKPMAVGSTGMLSTSNYAARKYGIRAGMPGFIGLKLYPSLAIVKPNFKKYKEVSQIMQGVFEQYDPNFAPMSLDEAYLDITNYASENAHLYTNDGKTLTESIVEEIRSKIEAATTLTASAGIAANCRLAKVCSDKNKPNGQYFLPPRLQDIRDFIEDLPVRKVSGIGGVTEQLLKALNIEKCCDLWEKRGLLRLLFSETSYTHFLSISLGLGSTEVEPSSERDRKSISTETTFSGTCDRKTLLKIAENLCDELADDLEAKQIFGRVFTLKIKTAKFEVKTRAKTLFEPANDAETMAAVASSLLRGEMNASSGTPLNLRLIGVRMSGLCHASQIHSSKKQLKLTSMLKKEPPSASSVLTTQPRGATVPSQDDEVVNISENSCHASEGVRVQTTVNHSSEEESYACPVCSVKIFSCLDALNSHVDVCLNRDLVRNLVKESSSLSANSSTGGIKRPFTHAESSSKKRKVRNTSKISNNKLPKPSTGLHKFIGYGEKMY